MKQDKTKLVSIPTRNVVLVRAITNIILGLVLLLFPGITLIVLAYAFAINAMIAGLFMVLEPTVDKKNKHAGITIALGLALVALGLLVMIRPLAGVLIISYIIAIWALLNGLVDILVGFNLTDSKNNIGWLFIIIGVISVIFSIFLAFNPIEGSLAVVWAIGLYSLLMGIAFAYQAARIKRAAQPTKKVKK